MPKQSTTDTKIERLLARLDNPNLTQKEIDLIEEKLKLLRNYG